MPFLGRSGLLALALVFVALVTYLPHLATQDLDSSNSPWERLAVAYGGWLDGSRDDYEYPVHADETMHWARMAEMQRSDTLRHPDPYTGHVERDSPQSLRGLVHEKGFYVAFAGFQEVTGTGWMDLIRLAPTAMAMVTASLVYVALRPWPAAPLAAALVALVPTTPRFLGIGFFVPIGIGLAWVACALVLLRDAGRSRGAMALLVLVAAWAFFVHLIIGFAVVLVTLVALPFLRLGGRHRLVFLAAGMLLPVAWFLDAFQPDVIQEAERGAFLPFDFTIFDQLGVPFLVVYVFGAALLLHRPPEGRHQLPLLAATLASIVALAFIVTNIGFGLGRYALYDRWHQPFTLFATVPVAYGVSWLFFAARNAARTWGASHPELFRRAPLWAGPMAIAFGMMVAGLAGGAVATQGVGEHLSEPFYYVLDDRDWRMFQAAAKLPDEYEVFLAHPWKAPIFTAMTGLQPHAWLQPGRPPINGDDYGAYMDGRFEDGAWLVSRDISLVLIADRPVDDPAFGPGPGGSSVLDLQLAHALYEARHAD